MLLTFSTINVNFFKIVRSTIKSNFIKKNIDYVFRNRHYVINKIKFFVNNEIIFVITKKNVYIDIDCSITLKNKKFIKQQLNKNIKIQQLILSLLIRKINNKLIKINDFIIIYLFVININNVNEIITIVVFVKIYLINNLKINMFVDVNIFKS